jgi:hypothetical protein
MHMPSQLGLVAALLLAAAPTQAEVGQGFSPCKSGFRDDTRVKTEPRGEMTIAEVRVNDRVWSMNLDIGQPGWSKVLRKVENAGQFRLFVDFVEPESSLTRKACWIIERTG